jgi:hypothetical protein
MKNNKLDHLLIFSIIIIIIIILVCKKKDKENYTGITPTKNHTPNNFVLLDITNDNNQNKKINFGFTQPKPHFIGNQVQFYELLIGLYDNERNFLKSVSHRFRKEDLKQKTQNGLLKISANIPQLFEDTDKLKEKYTLFKAGLRAVYPNSIYSNIIPTGNAGIQGFTFNKKENDLLLELGREFKNQINIESGKSPEDNKVCKEDLEFIKAKEVLGDYPNNLFLDNEDDLSNLISNTYNKADFNVKINDNVINKIFTFD